jgi:glycosyltransferase involved in cell wall biosynthesis
VRIGLDATYSLGKNLTGVGVYSREILFGLARSHPEQHFLFYYRPHRLLRSFPDSLPSNAHRRLLRGSPRVDLFHGLNQRVDHKSRRTVTTFHDLFVMTAEYSSPDFRARFTEQARRAADLSDAIIAVSAFTARQVEQLLNVEPSRIHVVHHGVRIPAPSSPHRREKLVLFVGAIQRRKNIAALVKAFEAMPSGWRLVLAGAADGFGADQELRAVEQSTRRSDIEVMGYVPPKTLSGLYQRASIFAFPSLDEGFGMPVLDAMANGVAAVTSRCSALPEVVGDAALLVDPLETEELSSALCRLADDEDLRNDLVRRGSVRAAEFTWEKAAAKTWAVYQILMHA